MPSRRRRGLLFIALSLTALFVYVPRTFRSLAVIGDSAELVTAAALWGVPHPPGYPLYTLVAHLFTRIPLLDVPFRVHVASACFHALTVGLVGCTIELLTGSIAAAVIGAAMLALGRIFFLGSLYAEVFPLNDLLFACSLLLAVRIARQDRDESAHDACGVLLVTVLGFAIAHHHMIALALPTLAILAGPSLWRRVRDRALSLVPLLAGALGPPLALYALIPLAASRRPALSWGDVHDLESLLHLVTRQDYGGLFRASRRLVGGQLLERLDALAIGTAESFGAVGLALFLAGTWWGLRHERRICVALLAATFSCGPLFAALNAIDIHSESRRFFWERFSTMCHVSFAAVIGLGAARVASWLRSRWPWQRRRGGGVVMAVLVVLAIAPLVPNLTALDFSGHRFGAAYAHDLVEATPDGALILLRSDMASQAALYTCAVEQRCGKRIILTPGQLWMPWKAREIERRYPALSLPTASARAWMVSLLVEQELSNRPVLIHPELVDDVVRGALSILPDMLLYRVYPNEQALRGELPRFRDELAAIARGSRCEGCSIARAPSQRLATDAQLMFVYEQAVRAHIRAANDLGLTSEGQALSAWQRRDP